MSQTAEVFNVSTLPPPQQSSVRLTLAEEDRWKEFAQFTNEFIVTKAGRKLFPKLIFVMRGLDPDGHYTFSLFMKLVGANRWKFSDGQWQVDGQSDFGEASNVIMHHDQAQSGKYWMNNTVSFDRLKLTSRPPAVGHSEISLSPMHKYQPVVHVTRWYVDHESGLNRPQLELVIEPSYTEFIAVTAYQNQQIIDLKIQHNPFARGFLEGSARERRASEKGFLQSSDSERRASNSSSEDAFALTISENTNEHRLGPVPNDDDAERGENGDGKWYSNLTLLRVFSFVIAVTNLIAAILCLVFIERAFLCILGIVASLACLYGVFMRAALAYLPLIVQFVSMTFLAAVSSSLCALLSAASQVEPVKKTIQYVLTVIVQTTLTIGGFQTYCSLFAAAFCIIALIFFAFAMVTYRAYRRQKEATAAA
ncbi:TBX-9 protein [Aphelenchoides avenae]|nr:TBX-9 protein [Aphelenchus avenae]